MQLDCNKIQRYWQALCLIDKNVFGNDFWTRENFERRLPSKPELSRVALFERKVLGYLIASRYTDRCAHIHRLAVSDDFRRKGIGTRLLRSFERACLRIGVKHVTLESLRSRNDANRFYERMGFRRISGEELLDYLGRKAKVNDMQRYFGASSAGESLVYSKLMTHAPAREGYY